MQTAEYLEYGGILAAGVSIYQAQQYHSKDVKKAHERHAATMELTREQHRKDLLEAKRNYLLEMFTNLEQHFQQLNADLIANSKEAERDMFDQRNQNFQAITLAASVMFGSLSTAIVDGYLPSSTGAWLIVTFALSSALSFSFLFFSMIICIEVMIHASQFMYGRARMHNQQLRLAIRNTQIMMNSLYENKEDEEKEERKSYDDERKLPPPPVSFRDLSSASSTTSSTREHRTTRERRFITQLNDADLDDLWLNHEKEVEVSFIVYSSLCFLLLSPYRNRTIFNKGKTSIPNFPRKSPMKSIHSNIFGKSLVRIGRNWHCCVFISGPLIC